MRRLPLFFLFFLFCLHLLPAQSRMQEQLVAIEQQRFGAMTQKDITHLEKVLADEVSYGHSNGLVENKREHLENIRTGKIVYSTISPLEMEVSTYKKSAVITGLIRVEGLYRETPFDIKLRYMDVYVKKRGKWKLAAWQSVKVE